MCVPHFVYPFIHQWTLWRFPQFPPKVLFLVRDPVQRATLHLVAVSPWASLCCESFSDSGLILTFFLSIFIMSFANSEKPSSFPQRICLWTSPTVSDQCPIATLPHRELPPPPLPLRGCAPHLNKHLTPSDALPWPLRGALLIPRGLHFPVLGHYPGQVSASALQGPCFLAWIISFLCLSCNILAKAICPRD